MSVTHRLKNTDAPLSAIERDLKGGDLLLLQVLRRWSLQEGSPVYLVGGPVRDALMGSPIKDLDFVVEGDAPKLAHRVAQATGGQVVVHHRFQTATVTLDDARVDIVTARRESYAHPAALPQVSPGNIEDDLARRDFSVNALALPLWEDAPTILDHHGGMEDMERGVLRVLHGRSFVDDPTRILRAIRYEQRLGFSMDDDTSAQLAAALGQGYMGAVTADRIRHELERIFAEPQPLLALKRGIQLGVLETIHSGLNSNSALERLASRAPSAPATGNPLYWLAALVYHLSQPQAEGLVRRLNMPNSWAIVARDTVALREMRSDLDDSASFPSKVSSLLEGLSPIAIAAVSSISDTPRVTRRLCQYLDEWRSESPLLTGSDVVAMGAPPGPMVGCILRELRFRRIDGLVDSEEEERQMVVEILNRKRSSTTHG